MLKITATHRGTPLDRFLKLLGEPHEVSGLTDKGMDNLRTEVRAALPHLEAIIAVGGWADWTDGPVAHAVNDVTAAMEPDLDQDPPMVNERQAVYVVGLLTGLALSHALEGARGEL